jgi:hypothetical protein
MLMHFTNKYYDKNFSTTFIVGHTVTKYEGYESLES